MDILKMDEWIVYGNTGISSISMWAALMDLEIKKCSKIDIPSDHCDFKRCVELYEYAGLNKKDLHKISIEIHFWKPLIDNWDELVSLIDDHASFRKLFNKVRTCCINLKKAY